MSSIVKWFKKYCTRDPYATAPKRQPVARLAGAKWWQWWTWKRIVEFRAPDSFREPRVAFVSRHGLLQAGLTCPNCNAKAAEPGEFAKVQPTSRGESVPCLECGTALLASPDDDIDPVSPGQDYDPAEYHTFVRAGPARRYQRMTSGTPAVRDWVVIVRYVSPSSGKDLDGAEGRVLSIQSREGIQSAEVALNGNDGFAGARDMGADIEWIPLIHLYPMIMPSLRADDPVVFIRGPHRGLKGKLTSCTGGRAEVSVPSGNVITAPIEHVERFHADELFTLPDPTNR